MSVTGVPVQLMNQTFDFALVCAIKGFWKDYKTTFSLAQLIAALKDNEQLWLESGHRNCNETNYRTSIHLSLQRLIEQAGIEVHKSIIPHLYELNDYSTFQNYEKQLVSVLYPQLVEIQFEEQLHLPFMSERSYQLWLLKQHEHNNLNYTIKFCSNAIDEQTPCIKVLILTSAQLSYLIRKAIRYNLVAFPPLSSSLM